MKKISIATQTGKTITFMVQSWDSIDTLKPKIHEIEGIPPDQQQLTFVEKQSEDDGTDHLVYCCCRGIQIRVISLTYRVKTVVLQVQNSDTIGDIKAKIQDMEGITVDKQRLIWLGKEIKDGKTVADYNIKNESRLYLSVTRWSRD